MLEVPQKCEKERQWFSSQYLRPKGVPTHPSEESLMTSYEEIIWKRPTRDMIVEYGSSVEEMSALCGEGPDGWLLSTHVDWLLRQANKQQQYVVCLSIPTVTNGLPNLPSGIKKFVFVANIGRTAKGETIFASWGRSGCHWVLIVLDITATPDIFIVIV
ncbi:hypothetical protein ElyMa_002857700 [Elysia marginata]|uniref:Ubiquitin-like protease family profile domain-containing protein n=1 Tax=Elysia marginata TaxID=1093978 RepID=A0AAV4HZP7_9GAST|nr:hypothetical protein ElyMa_002857700 [Elysia marginata]